MKFKEYEGLTIIWKSLHKASRVRILWLVGVIGISATLEMLSIALIIPFMESLTYGRGYKNSWIDLILNRLNIENYSSITIFSLLLCGTAAVSGLLRLWVIKNTTKLSFLSGAEISSLLFDRILNYEYCEISKRKSSEIIDLLTLKIHSLINSVIIPLFYLVNSMVMIAVIMTGLFILNPELSFMVFLVYGAIYYALSRSTRRHMHKNSTIISEKSQKIIAMTQEMIGGIKDIILGAKNKVHLDQFNRTSLDLRMTQANSVFLANSPKPILESIALILLGLAAYFLQDKDNEIFSLSAIAVIAIGTQKLLPMMQLMYSSINSCRENKHAIIAISSELASTRFAKYTSNNFLLNNEITFSEISYIYNKSKTFKVDVVNIRKGKKIAIIGASGVGKTTLLNIILGLLNNSSGEILADGCSVNIYNNREWFKRIAHVPQYIHVIDGSIAQNILYDFDISNINIPRVNECLRLSMLDSYVSGLEYGIFSAVGEGGASLSGGLRQRLGIARALYSESEILIFDEATSALDEGTEKELIEKIFDSLKNKTIIFVTHRKKILVYFDQIIELKA